MCSLKKNQIFYPSSFLLQDSSRDWQIVFYLAAAIYAVGTVVYGLLAEAKTQDWAQIPMGYRSYMDDPETQ